MATVIWQSSDPGLFPSFLSRSVYQPLYGVRIEGQPSYPGRMAFCMQLIKLASFRQTEVRLLVAATGQHLVK